MLHKEVHFRGPVLTLGNQDIWASYDDLKSFFQELSCSYSEATIIPHNSALFKTYQPLIERAKYFVHARTFFEMLGINDYWDLDCSDYENPVIIHDLNLPVAEELRSKFNLILDSGTMEHIFDVRQVVENLVRMCRASGWIVHITPASNFLDHGLYSFSPIFFYDVYGANGFDSCICYILQPSPRPLDYFKPCPYFKYEYGMSLDELIDPYRQTVIFFAAKKMKEVDTISVPMQGRYASKRPVRDTSSIEVSISQSYSLPSMLFRLLHGLPYSFLHPLLLSRFSSARRKILPRYRLLRRI